MVDLVGQFKDISTVTTLKFDVDFSASTGQRFNFDAQCGSALANLLAGNASLEKLDFSGQRTFSDLLDDTKSLAKLLKINTTLVNIAIGTVPDTASIKIIHEGLSKNKTLVTLHFHKIEDSDRK